MILDRYLLVAAARPLFLSVCVAIMLLLLERMLRLFDIVINEQGPAVVVWQMLANLVPHYLALALPLGTILGVLIAFRTLSQSGELDAVSAAGVSAGRLLRPLLVFVATLAVFEIALTGFLQPYARYQFRDLVFDLTNGAFGLKLPEGEFLALTDTTTVRFDSVDPATQQAFNIFVETKKPNGRHTITTAPSGYIYTSENLSQVRIRLNGAEQVFVEDDRKAVQTLESASHDITIELPQPEMFRMRGAKHDEKTLPELWSLLQSPDKIDRILYHEYSASFHRRLIYSATFLLLPFLGFAAGASAPREKSTWKPIAGVAVLIGYYELLDEWGRRAAETGALSPYVSMWGLYVVLAVLSLSLFFFSPRVSPVWAQKITQRIFPKTK